MATILLLLTLIPIFFQSTRSAYTAQLTEEKYSWTHAYGACKDVSRLLESQTFKNCQPESCKADKLKGKIDRLGNEDTIMWLNAYVLRSPVMQYYGCYQLLDPAVTIDSLAYRTQFDQNDVLTCSLYCRGKYQTRTGKFILLSNEYCYCLPDDTKNKWKDLSEQVEISSCRCNLSCPGNEYNQCGYIGHEGNDTIVSMYKFEDFSESISTELGQLCFYVEKNNLQYGNCFDEKKFKCQKFEVSDERVDKTSADCPKTIFSWYEAHRFCQKRKGRFLQTSIRENNCIGTDNVNDPTWHNRFMSERIIWNPDPKKVDGEQCLALHITETDEYKFVTSNCDENHRALCQITDEARSQEQKVISSTEKMYSVSRTRKQDITTSTETMHSTIPIVGGTVSAVIVGLLVAIIIIFRRKKKQNGKKSNVRSPIHNSAITDELRVEKNKTEDYTYAEETTSKDLLKGNDENVYNHLGDNETYFFKTTGNIYDHTGPMENTYDLTSLSAKCNPHTQDQLNLYDETRVIESEYDETSTKAAQTTKDTNDSAFIYNHI